MRNVLTRRRVMSAVPAVTLLATIPGAAGGAQADAELLRLGEALSTVSARQAKIEDALNATHSLDDEDVRWTAFDAAFREASAIVDQIEALQATTLAGLAVKARACHWCHSGEPIDAGYFCSDGTPTMDMRLGAGILGDLLAMGGAHA